MLATKIEDAKREEGFTLIELLVVVIIIGILAAIAIPVFLNQRESAWRSAVESDVRNAAMQVETYYTEHRAYPGSDQDGELDEDSGLGDELDVQISDQVTLTYSPDGGADDQFTITGEHEELDDDLVYDAGGGGLLDWGESA
ncbi:MAG: type IV pilin protein [Nitriliruptoraceae bacterium]